jgi:endonuclease I
MYNVLAHSLGRIFLQQAKWCNLKYILLILLLPVLVLADPPATYYDTVDLTSGATLRSSLHLIIDGHTKIPYTSSSTDTWDVLNQADQNPLNSTQILDVYQNRAFPKSDGGNDNYNREHTWPKSYGFPDDGSSNKPYTDCHHLFLCDIGYNGSRGSYIFDNCYSSCSNYPADNYNGQSGNNRAKNATPVGIWETWEGRRGDVARAMFYMDVRYEGDGSEPDLRLTDDPNLIVQYQTGNNEPIAYMGLLEVLLEWHLEDPVDDKERNHNDKVYLYQHNRNPFVDHPEWVSGVYLGIISGVDSPEKPARIASIYPNPFNPSTSIDISINGTQQLRVEVVAIDGSIVQTLLNRQTEGAVTLQWDGTDSTGQPVSSGTYFCRAKCGLVTDTKPMVLIK